MSRFYVGQRVRVLDIHGQRTKYQATIWHIGFIAGCKWTRGSMATGKIDPHDTPHWLDIDGMGRRDSDRTMFCVPAQLMEPIAPPPQLVSWAQCPWMPKQEVRA